MPYIPLGARLTLRFTDGSESTHYFRSTLAAHAFTIGITHVSSTVEPLDVIPDAPLENPHNVPELED